MSNSNITFASPTSFSPEEVGEFTNILRAIFGNVKNAPSIEGPRVRKQFMHDLHTRFPSISDREIDLSIAPSSFIVDGYEFTFAYQEEVTKQNATVVHTYYTLNVDNKAPEKIFARYMVFSLHALERMEERGILLPNILKAFVTETPRVSYNDSFLVNYENTVVVFKTTAEGFHQVITTYEVGEIFSNCFLEPIKGVDLNGTSEDLYNFCQDVVSNETNDHRVGKAALNIIKLIL